MIKNSYRAVLAISVLALCGAAYLLWYVSLDRTLADSESGLVIEPFSSDEPITPIPLDLKLDARKVALGQRLFNDPQLSRDNKTSCVQCHSLADGGMDRLKHPAGVGGKDGEINTLTIFNSGFNFRLFWDGRAATLEDQIDAHLQDTPEIGAIWPEIIARLQKDSAYRRDFSDIYDEGIQPQTVRNAIATFERSLTTPNSKFDRFLRGDRKALNSSELAGYDLFKSLGCISCHQGRNVGGNMYEKLGLMEDYFKHRGNIRKVDYGRYNVTKADADRYRFRVPSLRNVALTAPYFHDATASTLEGAVLIMGKYQLGVDLREDEVAKIVKFLNTLTGEYQGRPLR